MRRAIADPERLIRPERLELSMIFLPITGIHSFLHRGNLSVRLHGNNGVFNDQFVRSSGWGFVFADEEPPSNQFLDGDVPQPVGLFSMEKQVTGQSVVYDADVSLDFRLSRVFDLGYTKCGYSAENYAQDRDGSYDFNQGKSEARRFAPFFNDLPYFHEKICPKPRPANK
jgi:hypothetical protein